MNMAYQTADQALASYWALSQMSMSPAKGQTGKLPAAKEDSFETRLNQKAQENQKPQSEKADKAEDAPQKTDAAGKKPEEPVEEQGQVQQAAEEPATVDRLALAAALLAQGQPQLAEPVTETDPTVETAADPLAQVGLEETGTPVETNAVPVVQEQAADRKPEQNLQMQQETQDTPDLHPQTEAEAVSTETFDAQATAESVQEVHTENVTAKSDSTVTAEVTTAEDGQETEEAEETPVFEHLEAVPVRVADRVEKPEAPIELETPQAPEQIAAKIGPAIDAGASHVELSLSPEHLGKLTVELTRSGDGTLSVVIHASTPKAAALLEQHADGLQQLLAASNRDEVQVEVRGNTEAQQQFLNPNENGQRQQEQQQQHQRNQQEDQNQQRQGADMDFMQRLRLGLTAI